MSRVSASDFHDIDGVSEPRLSPDGETVAFVRTTPDDDESYEATVQVVPADGGGEPSAFTVGEGVDSAPRWSPSGDRLAFVSTRGADGDRPQLWLLPVDGGEARRLTDVPGGVREPSWSPDGDRLAFLQSTTAAEREAGDDCGVSAEYERETPDPRVVDRTVYRTGQEYHDGARAHAYVVDAASGTVERVTDGDVDHGSLAWGDAETLYVAASDVGDDPDDSVRYAIVAHDPSGGGSERLHETSGFDPRLAATGDGRVAHVHADADRTTIRQSELHVYDAGTGEVHRVTEGFDRTLDRAVAPQWGPDGEDLLFATPDEGKTSLWRAPGDGSAAPERVARPGHVDGAHAGDDAVALTMSEWDHPGDVFVHDGLGAGDAAGDGVRRLTEVNAGYLADRAVAEPEELRFDSGGVEIQGWLLTPPEFDPEETYPLAVEIHGGPHAMWSTAGTMWHEFQTLAARGYVVLWSNPRGSAGYGSEHMRAIERDWGEVTLTDVMAGVDRATERDYVDAGNAFVTGGSFGGFMAAWAVGRTDFFRAAVAQRGVYDLTGFYGSTDWAYKLVEGDFDTTPTEEPAFLWAQSPAAHADAVDTPTLVIHSDDDYRTPACTAELWYRLLRTNGVDTRLVRYPREGHELSRSGEPGHRVDRIERIVRWFDGYADHSDAPPALERDRNDGLSAGENGGSDA